MQSGLIALVCFPANSDCLPSFVARLCCYIHHQMQGRGTQSLLTMKQSSGGICYEQEGFETSQRQAWWKAEVAALEEGQAQLPPAQHWPQLSLASQLSRELQLVTAKHGD